MITASAGPIPSGYSAQLNRLLEFCRTLDTTPLHEGRYDHYFPGEDIVVLINERTTQPRSERPAEVHRHYVELHYVVEGGECIGYYPDRGGNRVTEDRLAEKDTLYYADDPAAPELMIPLGPGDYAVFFPEDVHRPFCLREKPEAIKKIVIKYPVE
ncbi:MAG: YhcH/YjgK/YiaL family protein [Gemmiger sp.]